MSANFALIQTNSIAAAADGWSLPIAFQQFDTSSGTLTDVALTLVGTVTGVAAIENLGATPATVSLGVSGNLGLFDASGNAYTGGQTSIKAEDLLSLGAYDGSVDFAGLSGTLTSFSNTGTAVTSSRPGSAAGYEGTGTIGVTVTSSAQSLTEYSTGNILSVTQGEAGATVNLRYDYRTNGTGTDGSSSGSYATSVIWYNPDLLYGITVAPTQTTDVQVLRLADAKTGWNGILDAQQFNPALGTLDKIEVTVIGDINAALALENLGSVGTNITLYDTAVVTVTLPGALGRIGGVSPSLSTSASLSGFDGTIDFQGSSGRNLDGLTGTGSFSTIVNADNAFIGTGTVAIGVGAQSHATLSAGADLATELLTNAGAIVEISYVYYPVATIASTPVFTTPVITGTEAGVAFVEQSGVAPFAGIAIHNDGNIGQTDTVTITQSNPGNGTLAASPWNFGLNGTYDTTAGVWTATGSAASLTTALQQLAFFASGQVAPGQTIATGFTVAVTDSAAQAAVDTTTSVIETSGVAVDPVVTAAQVGAALLASDVNAKPVSSASSTGPFLTLLGSAVTASNFPGWTPIAAIQTASGFDIAWKYAPTGQFTVWTTDANGNVTGDPNGVVAVDDPSLESIETIFGTDLNGDGSIGLAGATVGTATASASLAESGNIYMVQANGGPGFDLKVNGVALSSTMFAGWTALAAVTTASGFDVAWKYAATGQYTIWQTDAAGNFTGDPNGVVNAGDPSLQAAETIFGLDLNSDGTIGVAGTPTGSGPPGSNGNDGVPVPDSGNPVPLNYKAAASTMTMLPRWTAIAAVQMTSGIGVAPRSAPAGQFTALLTGPSGYFTFEPSGVAAGIAPSFASAATAFGVGPLAAALVTAPASGGTVDLTAAVRPTTVDLGPNTAYASTGLNAPSLTFVGTPDAILLGHAPTTIAYALTAASGIETISNFTYGLDTLNIDLACMSLGLAETSVGGVAAISIYGQANPDQGIVLLGAGLGGVENLVQTHSSVVDGHLLIH